jgi:acetyl-CoA carboxylase biotin carboxylase subunit
MRRDARRAAAAAPRIRKVLVANRGEVAVRVIRACRDLGLSTVAVFSAADREAPHVLMADEAYPIGPPEPAASYLSIDRIIETARAARADAVHPGYGFLAESPRLAEACQAGGLIFVGPPAGAMRAMSDKTAARRTATALGIPIVPGTSDPLADDAEVARAARDVGYPVMIKASMGGGGKGMRRVDSETELVAALRLARSEAAAAFADSSVYLERYVPEPRHIEIQVLADAHGTVLHLGERECSIQRRHQKLIEESPSPLVDAEMRARMGEAACRLARAVGYVNAGTVEFLVDRDREFHFLEMNTRLQVEHPVTEMVTGIDIVTAQLRVAAGAPLALRQEDIALRGAAVECRINAEDPLAGWLPSPGTITGLRPAGGPWVRHDAGVYEGYTVPRYYDTLVAKLITWGDDRDLAIERMMRALSEYRIAGVRTTIPALLSILRHPEFRAGRLSTGLLDAILPGLRADEGRHRALAIAAAALAAHARAAGAPDRAGSPPAPPPLWRLGARPGWR